MNTIKTKDKIEIKPGYKKTSVGIIPEEWEEMRLEQVSKIIMGVSPNSENYNFEGQGKFLIQGNADIRNRKSAPRQYTSEITKECQVGDILMSVRAPVGEIAKSIHNACIGRGVCAIRNNKKADGEFLFYYLLNTEVLWSRFKQGSTFESVNSTDIRNFTIQIPPIQEQKAIADCLSTWDSGIEKLTQLIQAKKQQKKGLMQRLLTGTLRVTSASGEKFDGEWKEVRLGEIGETFNGLTGKTKDDFGEGFPYVSYLNVFNNNAIMETTIFDFVQIKEGENQTRLKYGDLIFTTSSETPDEVGMSGVMLFDPKQDLFLNSFCFGLRMENFEELEPNFAVYLLRGEQFRKEMYKLAQGSTRFNLSKAGFRKINLLVPPIKEQTAIAEILQAADKEIELLEQKLSVLQEQKKGLMQVLLTGEKRLITNNR